MSDCKKKPLAVTNDDVTKREFASLEEVDLTVIATDILID